MSMKEIMDHGKAETTPAEAWPDLLVFQHELSFPYCNFHLPLSVSSVADPLQSHDDPPYPEKRRNQI